MARGVVKESKFGEMEINMTDFGIMIKGKNRESLCREMVMYMKGSGRMGVGMGMVFRLERMEINAREIECMMRCLGLVLAHINLGLNTLETFGIVSPMVKENKSTKKVGHMKECELRERSMDKEFIFRRTERLKKLAFGKMENFWIFLHLKLTCKNKRISNFDVIVLI